MGTLEAYTVLFSLSAGFLNDREMQDLLSRMLDVTARKNAYARNEDEI